MNWVGLSGAKREKKHCKGEKGKWGTGATKEKDKLKMNTLIIMSYVG